MDFCLRVLCTRSQVFGNGVSSDFDAAPVCVRGMGARWFCRLYQSSGSDSTVAEWQCKKEEDKSREDRPGRCSLHEGEVSYGASRDYDAM